MAHYTGKIVKQNAKNDYEVSFSDGRWILPQNDIEFMAKSQLNLSPTSRVRKSFKKLTGYKKLVFQTVSTKVAKSAQKIVSEILHKNPSAKPNIIKKSIKILLQHKFLKTPRKYPRFVFGFGYFLFCYFTHILFFWLCALQILSENSKVFNQKKETAK